MDEGEPLMGNPLNLKFVQGNPSMLQVRVNDVSFYVRLKELLDEKRFAQRYEQASGLEWPVKPGFRSMVCAAFDAAKVM